MNKLASRGVEQESGSDSSLRRFKFIRGLANCHVPGLFSLVISDRVDEKVGMSRVFYAEIDMPLWKNGGDAEFNILPHNHQQSLRLTPIKGHVQNVEIRLSTGYGTLRLWNYAFTSALQSGAFGLERRGYHDASYKIYDLPLDGLSLHFTKIHTVTAKAGSAWLVEEFEQAPPGFSSCWSVSDHLTLNAEGLYLPMSCAEILRIESILAGERPE